MNKRQYPVKWTKQSLIQATSIKNYLKITFSIKEVQNFIALLKKFEITVTTFPKIYPISKSKNIHRAVLNKRLSVYYQFDSKEIIVVSVIDNRQDSFKL